MAHPFRLVLLACTLLGAAGLHTGCSGGDEAPGAAAPDASPVDATVTPNDAAVADASDPADDPGSDDDDEADAAPTGKEPGPGSTLAQEIAFLAGGCRDEMIGFTPGNGAATEQVFRLVYYDGQPVAHDAGSGKAERPSWHHDVNDCLQRFTNAIAANPTSGELAELLWYQTLYELAEDNVALYQEGSAAKNLLLGDVAEASGDIDVTHWNRVGWLTEKNGFNYEAQVQGEFGAWLLHTYDVILQKNVALSPARREMFRAIAFGTMKVVTDPAGTGADERGLRARSDCALKSGAKCSFYYAVTSNDRASTEEGATLNKAIEAVRDLYQSYQALTDVDTQLGNSTYADVARTFHDGAVEGVNQLVYGAGNATPGSPPKLQDYIARNTDGAIERSWAYYSLQPITQKAYFLHKEHEYKNCNYDVRNLSLLANTLQLMKDEGLDLSGYSTPVPALNGKSVLRFMLATYQDKVDEGFYDEPTKPVPAGGDFEACVKKYTDKLPDDDLAYLKSIAGN